MSTGYTCYIDEGKVKTGKDFLRLCLRAMKAGYHMRDDGAQLDAPIKKPQAGDYYLEQMQRLHAKKAKLMTSDPAQLLKEWHQENAAREDRLAQERAKYRKIEDLYDRITKEVRDWNPPTPKHQGLKDFALEQLRLGFDEDRPEQTGQLEGFPPDCETCKQEQIKHLESEIQRAMDRYNDEVQQNAVLVEWLNHFFASIDEKPPWDAPTAKD